MAAVTTILCRNILRLLWVGIVALAPLQQGGAAMASDAPRGLEPGKPGDVVLAYIAAFSRQDLPALIAMTHPDIEWLTVTGATISVESRGQPALEASLRGYFKSCPSCQSSVAISAVNGRFVSAVETASWLSKGVQRSQSSLSVYELEDGKILRVWYFASANR